MIYNDSKNWVDYTKHVLQWEGKTSKDPDDTASKCIEAGKIHTNKGLTYCSFKENAQRLKITPVNYERFLNLTDEEIGKFIYSYFNKAQAQNFPDSLALAITESAWGSGNERAYKHLYDALDDLGQSAKNKTEAIINASKIPDKVLFDLYITKRRQYLDFLGKNKKYAKFYKGWINRLNSFYNNFNPDNLKKNKSSFTLEDFFTKLLNFSK